MISIINNTGGGIVRKTSSVPDVSEAVSAIIADVRANGDMALRNYSIKFDGADLESFEVTPEEIAAALEEAGEDFVAAITRARDNIADFHRNQKRSGFIVTKNGGIVTGQRILPLERVGLYVPGGTASYPSTVLMDCLPAKIAGVEEVIMVSPPSKDGRIDPAVLAAASIAGVDRIFKIGGAQAVAALAYGTESVPRVDKIVGPGNVYVAEAKRQVYGIVDIDMIAGPSEILIVADSGCRPEVVAADMLSQAEHDKMASAVLITDSEDLAEAVSAELEKQIPLLPRAEIARVSIDNNGQIIIVSDINEAIDIANEFAPEHLEICVDSPMDYLPQVKNAGAVFLGRNTPEALGDYYAGPNHTLPTSGTARFSGPLSVDDFEKRSSFIYYTADALEQAKDDIALLAHREGLDAHARSVTIRFDEKDGE